MGNPGWSLSAFSLMVWFSRRKWMENEKKWLSLHDFTGKRREEKIKGKWLTLAFLCIFDSPSRPRTKQWEREIAISLLFSFSPASFKQSLSTEEENFQILERKIADIIPEGVFSFLNLMFLILLVWKWKSWKKSIENVLKEIGWEYLPLQINQSDLRKNANRTSVQKW